LAHAKKDAPQSPFLKWFIDEQVEEEKNASEDGGPPEAGGRQSNALLLLDMSRRPRVEA